MAAQWGVQPPPAMMEEVKGARRPEVLGFHFDRARGGFLLVMYDKDEKILKQGELEGRVQVRDRREASQIVKIVKPHAWEIFSESDLFGNDRILCIVSRIVHPDDTVFVNVDVAGYSNSMAFFPQNEWKSKEFAVDTGAAHTLVFVSQEVYDNIGKIKSTNDINKFAYPESTKVLANGSEAMARTINLAVRIGGVSVYAPSANVMPYPKEEGDRKFCTHLLGMDILRQCMLTFANEVISLAPVPESGNDSGQVTWE